MSSRQNPWADEPDVIPCRLAHRSNGAMAGGPAKCVLHISAYDPGGVLNFERQQGDKADYHVAYDPIRDQLLAPFYPLTESARALRRSASAGTIQTNRDQVLQPCLLGTVQQIQGLTIAQLQNIGRRLIAPMMRHYPEIRWRRWWAWYDRANGSSGRMSGPQWDLFDGFCGHQSVPFQDPTWHWDPCLRADQIDVIVTAAEQELSPPMATVVAILPMPATLTPGAGASAVLDTIRVNDSESRSVARAVGGGPGTVTPGRGHIEVLSDGGTNARDGAPFFGSAYPMPAGEPLVGGMLTPTGDGMILVSAKGGVFIPTNGDAPNRGKFLGSAYPKATQAIAPIPGGYRLIHGPSSWTDFKEPS